MKHTPTRALLEILAGLGVLMAGTALLLVWGVLSEAWAR